MSNVSHLTFDEGICASLLSSMIYEGENIRTKEQLYKRFKELYPILTEALLGKEILDYGVFLCNEGHTPGDVPNMVYQRGHKANLGSTDPRYAREDIFISPGKQKYRQDVIDWWEEFTGRIFPRTQAFNALKTKSPLPSTEGSKDRLLDSRRDFTDVEVFAALDTWGMNCYWCNAIFDETIGLTKVVGDHYIPHSLGGPTIIANCVPSCIKCNLAKGDKMPDVYSIQVLNERNTGQGRDLKRIKATQLRKRKCQI